MVVMALCVDVIGGGEAVVAVEADQGPVWIRRVIDIQHGIFVKGEFLVGLSSVVVEGPSLVDGRGLDRVRRW